MMRESFVLLWRRSRSCDRISRCARTKRICVNIRASSQRVGFLSTSSSSGEEKREKKPAFHHVWNVPNAITMTRVVLAAPLAYALHESYYKIAFAGIAFGGFCDWLDGYLARKWNQQTVLGSFLDPAADKFLVAAIVAPMAMKGLLSPWLVGVVIGRDVLLLGGGFVYRWWTRPPGAPFFNTTHGASFEVKPTQLSKINTAAQLGLCAYVVTNAAFGFFPIHWSPYLEVSTGALTVASGLQYVAMFASRRSSGYVKIKQDDKRRGTGDGTHSGG